MFCDYVGYEQSLSNGGGESSLMEVSQFCHFRQLAWFDKFMLSKCPAVDQIVWFIRGASSTFQEPVRILEEGIILLWGLIEGIMWRRLI
jgi:hypothetical protein